MKTLDEQSRCRDTVNEAASKELKNDYGEEEFWNRVENAFNQTGYHVFLRHFNNFPVRIFGQKGLLLGFVDGACSHIDGNTQLPEDILELVEVGRNQDTREFHRLICNKIIEESQRKSLKESIIEGARNELKLRGMTDVIFTENNFPSEFYVGNQQLRQRLEEEYVRTRVFEVLRLLVVKYRFSYLDLIS